MQAASRKVIVGVVVCLLTLYVVRVYLTISTDYRLTIRGAEEQMDTLSSVLEQHASRTMGEAEGMLSTVSELLLKNDFASDATKKEFHQYALRVLQKSPQIKSIFLVTPQGEVFATSGPQRFKDTLDARDREYYIYHKTHRETESHISAPVQSRIDGSRLFTITRRMEAADGSLTMIAGVALEPSYFNRFYRQLSTSERGGRFALLRDDGAVLINVPTPSSNMPHQAGLEKISGRILPLKTPHGVLQPNPSEKGPRSLIAYRSSRVYPMVSVVSLPMDEILEPWKIRAFWHGAGAATSILLISILTFSLVGRLKRLDRANSSLLAQQQELELAAHVFEQSQQSIVITDRDGIILRVNQYFTELTGYLPEEVVGQTPRVLKSQRHDEEFYHEFWKCLVKHGKWKGEVWNRRKNGDGFAALLSICSVRDAAGEITHYIGMIEDITEQKLSSERIYHLAHFDVLTNLPNRRLFNDRLVLTLRQGERYQNRFAIMFLDLDNFKKVNDSLGHHAGDLLLQAVAQRLADTIRKIDTVARLGGDEFAVLLEDIKDPADVKRVSEKLIAAVSEPLELEGTVVQVGVSVGVSIYPTDGTTIDRLIKNADSAMYRAKAQGKNRCQFFDAGMAVQANSRLGMEGELREGIPEELFLLYQPQATLSEGKAINGVEALVRWRHPLQGVLLPPTFIGLAEETGQIGKLGFWVMERACRQAALWYREHGHRLRVTVNVSALQIHDPSFPATVEMILGSTGLPAPLLELELSEAAAMSEQSGSFRCFKRLHEMGVGLALDHFGTGCASLPHLQRLPISRLKIDQSVIGQLHQDADQLSVLRIIVAMARTLKLETVAVGVETEAQLKILRQEGCDQFQGSLLAGPLPEAELVQMLNLPVPPLLSERSLGSATPP